MSILRTLSFALLILALPVLAVAQSEFALHSVAITVESPASADQAKGEGNLLAINMDLYIQSEVAVQIRDAFGKIVFQSEDIYEEGKQDVRVKLNGLERGIYFLSVRTPWEEKKDMLVLPNTY